MISTAARRARPATRGLARRRSAITVDRAREEVSRGAATDHGPVPPGAGRRRSTAGPGSQERLSEAGDGGQARRARPVHRRARRRHAGDPELEVGRPYVKAQAILETAQALVAGDKGLLAMDESTPTCNRRFAALRIPQTEEARRAYRELIVTTPHLGEFISGAILYDETIHQETKDGTPGIKVDTGAKDLAGHPGEKVTEGLDGLRNRLAAYAQMGARFAKWRAVIVLGDGIPSRGCIEANAQALARYAALCQEVGLVPVLS